MPTTTWYYESNNGYDTVYESGRLGLRYTCHCCTCLQYWDRRRDHSPSFLVPCATAFVYVAPSVFSHIYLGLNILVWSHRKRESYQLTALGVTNKNISLHCDLVFQDIFLLCEFILNNTFWNASWRMTHSVNQHAPWCLTHTYLCKLWRNKKIILTTSIVLCIYWKLLEKAHNSDMQMWEIFIGPSLWGHLVTKVPDVSISIRAQRIDKEEISYFFVGDSLLVLVMSLKTDILLIYTNVFTHKTQSLLTCIMCFRHGSSFQLGWMLVKWVSLVRSVVLTKALNSLCLVTPFFSKIEWHRSEPFNGSLDFDLNL